MKKKTKVLLTSAATIAMSACIVAGGTFALFVDEERVNIAVTAGDANVTAVIDETSLVLSTYGEEREGLVWENLGTATFVDGHNLVLDGITPADAADFNVVVTNESTIAIKYQTRVSYSVPEGADEAKSAALFDALRFQINGSLVQTLAYDEQNEWYETDWATWLPTDEATQTVPMKVSLPAAVEDATVEGAQIVLYYTVFAVQANARGDEYDTPETELELPENSLYEIDDAYDMQMFARGVNEGNEAWVNDENLVVTLTNDIYLDDLGEEWTPIGANADALKKFNGTFDGNGYTIYGLTIKTTQTASTYSLKNAKPAYAAYGLFGALSAKEVKNFTVDGAYIEAVTGGDATVNGFGVVAGSTAYGSTISNVTVKNSTVKGNRYVGGIVGYMDGTVTGCTVENVTLVATPNLLDNGKYDNGDKVGGIVGYANSKAEKISGNTVNGLNATGYRDIGGIVGALNAATVSGNTVKGKIVLTSDQTTYFYETKDANLGAIVGRYLTGTIENDNSEAEATVEKTEKTLGLSEDAEIGEDGTIALESTLNSKTEGNVSITVPASAPLSWTTGAAHGSTPFGGEQTGDITIVGSGAENSSLVFTGAGVGAVRTYDTEKTLTIKDVTIVDESVSYKESAWEFTYLEFGGKLYFENVVFTSGIQLERDANATFVNCTFISGESSVYAVWIADGSATFTGCTFTGTRGLKAHEEYDGSDIGTIVVDGCTFENLTEKPGIAFGNMAENIEGVATVVTIKNCKFINCQPGDQENYMYESDTPIEKEGWTLTLENNTVIP